MDITIKKEYFKESPYAEYSEDITLNALGIFDITAIPGGGTLLKFNFGLEEIELKTDLIVTITMLANLVQDANMSFEKNTVNKKTTTEFHIIEKGPHKTIFNEQITLYDPKTEDSSEKEADKPKTKKTWSRRKKNVEPQNPNELESKNTQNSQEPVKKAKRPYHRRKKNV